MQVHCDICGDLIWIKTIDNSETSIIFGICWHQNCKNIYVVDRTRVTPTLLRQDMFKKKSTEDTVK